MNNISKKQLGAVVNHLKTYPCKNELESCVEILEEVYNNQRNEICENANANKSSIKIKCICEAIESLQRAIDCEKDDSTFIQLAISRLNDAINCDK